MYTIYPLNHPYGNYLDGFYTRDYLGMAETLKEQATTKLEHINLGIQDGVMIINNLKGDFKGYNCCIVENEETEELDIYKIVAKTFVRRDIWQVTMIVDCFSKYYTDILESTLLIERLGYKNYTDFNPILFNEENFTLSQIKTAQKKIPLYEKDTEDVQCGGYLMIWQQDALKEDRSVSFNYSPQWLPSDFTVDGIKNFDLTNGETLIYKGMNDTARVVVGTDSMPSILLLLWHGTLRYKKADVQKDSVTISTSTYVGNWSAETSNMVRRGYNVLDNIRDFEEDMCIFSLDLFKSALVGYIRDNILPNYKSYLDYSSYNNKYVEDTSTGYMYKITITEKNTTPTIFENDIDVFNILMNGQNVPYTFKQVGGTLRFGTSCTAYTVTLTKVTDTNSIATGNATITAKRNTYDQGYSVIFVPYFWGATEVNLDTWTGSGSHNTIFYNQETTKTILQAFYNTYGGDNGFLLDIQEFYGIPGNMFEELLECYNTTFSSNLVTPEINIDGTEVTIYLRAQAVASETPVEVTDICNYSSLLFYALSYAEGEIITDFEYEGNNNLKLEQQNTYHLCSPSGTSVYEFSLAKNKGLHGFRYKYNIRPYGSVYQLQPIYDGYYGDNYTDTRGLGMAEPTSITVTSSEWETYKRQNINYINSFESNQEYERSSLQLKQDYQKEQYKLMRVRSGMNTYMGTSSTVTNGLLSGNLLGAAASSAYQIADEAINSAITKTEFKNYQKQESDQLALAQAEERRQWEYSLGNIQALPYNTEKLSEIYNTNFHAFYLEVFEPTDYEKDVYSKYLDLFGIKVGSVIPLSSYEFDYIEGSVIKLSIGVTQEEYKEINTELKGGRRLYESVEE